MVIHLSKILQTRPTPKEIPDLRIRNFLGAEDIAVWLDIHHHAFASQIAGARPWTEQDFYREFLEKKDWRPEWLWFAEPSISQMLSRAVGAIGLRIIERQGSVAGAVSWLAVLPTWRRRGVGELLLTTVEGAAWEAGARRVVVETLTEWSGAIAFYRSAGYLPIPPNGRQRL